MKTHRECLENHFNPVFRKFKNQGKIVSLINFQPSLLPALIENLLENKNNRNIVFVFSHINQIERYQTYIEAFFPKGVVTSFPGFDIFPYEFNEIDPLIKYQRIKTADSLLSFKNSVVLTTLYGFSLPMINRKILSEKKIMIRKNFIFDQNELIEMLVSSGYKRVDMPEQFGEFSCKGEFLHLFYSPYENPVKIDFFDNQIEFIKSYEKDSLKILGNEDEIVILPVKEFWMDEVDLICENLYKMNSMNEDLDYLVQDMKEGIDFALLWNMKKGDGVINYLSDYLSPEDCLIFVNAGEIKGIWKEENKKFEKMYGELDIKGLSTPMELLHPVVLEKTYERYSIINTYSGNEIVTPSFNCNIHSIPKYENNIESFKNDIKGLSALKYSLYFFGNSEQLKRLKILFPLDNAFYLEMSLPDGFIDESQKKCFYSYYDIIHEKIRAKTFQEGRVQTIENYLDIKKGEYIVHLFHGIGIYKGIHRIVAQDEEKDYICLEYRNNEEINIPIENIGLLQKYIGFGQHKPKLDAVGGKTWKKNIEKTKAQVYEYAKGLYDLYKERQKQIGIEFLKDDEEMRKFEEGFPYSETFDQLKSIDQVKEDMENTVPMDRLICGDVGFGKTEVAMRAAFKAISSGYQVAVLTPTTVLANQHYEVFNKRFSLWPIKIEMLSRLVDKSLQKPIVENLRKGNIDIIIGTHRILSQDIGFKKLGLLIIDEEQKFGVEAKERLKEYRHNIDVLSLSATPIPRTLYLSLVKLRPVSVINTPPESRKPVDVQIAESSDEIIIKAIQDEIKRGGKVFIIHNRVKTIPVFTNYVKSLFSDPDFPITYVHGRMDKKTIKSIVHRFIEGDFKVLVSTTIIESGVDMPDVNTIIIDRADRFGLSTLYQLKGRVGRREQKAYAYLLYHSQMVVNEIALKRLQVISDYAELGSGYKIALKDLEIRGAGNVLGKEQSGFVQNVGFYMYQKLLDDVVNEIENKQKVERFKSEVELEIGGAIPDDYIDNTKTKIEIYQMIYNCDEQNELEKYKQNIEKTFGPLPETTRNLFSINMLRIKAQQYFIDKIFEEKEFILFLFSQKTKIKMNNLINKIQKGLVKVNPQESERFRIPNTFLNFGEKLGYIDELLDQIFEH